MQCCLCSSDRAPRIFEKSGLAFRQCDHCEFIFTRPPTDPNFADVLEDYPPAYLSYLEGSLEDESNHTALFRWANDFHPVARGAVLDVGTGGGSFVRFLRRRGIDAFGIEPAAPVFSRFLSGEDCFARQTLSEFEAGAEAGSLDTIFASDVLEHVDRPDRFLAEAARLLRPGGMLFVSTPDVGSLTSRILGRRWHYFNKYHLSYLSRKTIGSLAARCGLREAGFDRLPRVRSVGYLLRYLANFVFGLDWVHVPKGLDRLLVSINLHDAMTVAFERAPTPLMLTA